MTEYEIKRLCDRVKELARENTDLKAQIEKMKCCSNCRKMKYNSIFAPICTVMNDSVIENPLGIKCDKWEIRK